VVNMTRYARLFPFAPARKTQTAIARVLDRYPRHLVDVLIERGTQIHPLGIGQRYADASPALTRLGIDVDAWPVAPAGLFVIEERTLYLRSLRMTISHELGHALDCALGNGSSTLARLESHFQGGATRQVKARSEASTGAGPCAGTSPDEARCGLTSDRRREWHSPNNARKHESLDDEHSKV
ncbi:MAG: hypothetical protein ACREM8_10685, partial [Vulcanimicrobiaceae bacterium]